MPAEEFAAAREDERVTRLFPGRARDRGDVRVDAAVSAGDSTAAARGQALFARLEPRLDAEFEHKLLEPLSQIRTMASVLNDRSDSRLGEPLGAIDRAAERAEFMLRDIVDLLRSAAGGLVLARRRVDLKLLCERVVDAIHAGHPDRPMVFTSHPRVEGEWDPDRMAMLVSKLVLNAIQHGPSRPAIRIELQGLPDHAIFQVWNAGAIADADRIDRIFEPFVCAPVRQAGNAEGLGLGLFLAREIARAHRGQIDVQSSEADGTTFRVTVPRL